MICYYHVHYLRQIHCWHILTFWKCKERHRNPSRYFKQEELERRIQGWGNKYQRKPTLVFRKPGSVGIPGDVPPMISAAWSTEMDDLLEHAGSCWQSLLLPSAEALIPVAHCFRVNKTALLLLLSRFPAGLSLAESNLDPSWRILGNVVPGLQVSALQDQGRYQQ